MQLIRCYVENFGKLSDVNLDFQNGMNVLCRNNGWGKSSLAVFICAMFYGLANDKKHGEADNERKHYMPWQGGVFGGNLTFRTERGEYTIYRTFGRKAREDTFELRDARTNLPSDLYPEEIGEALFQLDRESFIRTAFLFQDSCETLATSGINAKIHNLADDTNDMNNYDLVNRQLLAEMNALGENRATGALARLKAQEWDLKEAVRTGPIWERKLKELTERKERLQQKLEETTQQQEQLLLIQNQQEYLRAEEEVRERRAACESLMTFFHGVVPANRELDEQHALLREIEELRNQREECTFSQEELEELDSLDRIFGENLPSDEEIRKQYDSLERIDVLQSENIRTEDRIWADTEADSGRKKVPQPNHSGSWFLDRLTETSLLIAGFALIFVGLMVMKLWSPEAGGVAVLFGIVLAAAVVVYRIMIRGIPLPHIRRPRIRQLLRTLKNKRIFRQTDEDPEEEDEEEDEAAGEWDGLDDADDNGRKTAAEEIADRKASIRSFLLQYTDDPVGDEELEEKLAAIDTAAERYRELFRRSRKYQEITELLRRKIIRQNEYLRRYVPARKGAGKEKISAETRLRQITEARNALDHAAAEYRKAREKADQLKQETEETTGHPVTEELISSGELSDRLRFISNLRLEQQKELEECRYEIEKVQKVRDEAAVFAGKLEKLQEEIAQKQHEYEVIHLTQEILTEARNNINSRYMKPIMNAFLKYYRMINPEEAEQFYIDGDSRITVQAGGKQRETSLLSKGYQDMIGLCLRMSLLDAMYPGEKPFLVMDDPLVNLDEIRLQGGMDFLKQVSEKYQILYLTCHEEMNALTICRL